MIITKWLISAVLLAITLGIPFIIITKITKREVSRQLKSQDNCRLVYCRLSLILIRRQRLITRRLNHLNIEISIGMRQS